MPNPGDQSGKRQRGCGYQQITSGAVDDGEEDLEPRAGRPDCIERQLGRFPYEMDSGSRDQVEQNRAPKESTASFLGWRPAHNRRKALVPMRTELIDGYDRLAKSAGNYTRVSTMNVLACVLQDMVAHVAEEQADAA